MVYISAMIRPQTPRRGADRTMRVFSRLYREFQDIVQFDIFGCYSNSENMKQLETNFEFNNHEVLIREEVADLLAKSDVFVDLSDYQAFGRTALEAMACGATAIVPQYGGVDEYAVNNVNSLIVDSFNEDQVYQCLRRLILDRAFLFRLKNESLKTASNYSSHQAAVSELTLLTKKLINYRANHLIISKKTLILIPSKRQDEHPTGSAYVRLLYPYKSSEIKKKWHIDISLGKNLPLIPANSGNIAIIQREAKDFTIEQLKNWLNEWRKKGNKLFYEIDDDLTDGDALTLRKFLGNVEELSNKVIWLATNADLITVSSSNLFKKFNKFNKNIKLVPNVIDNDLWKIDIKRDHLCKQFGRKKDVIRIGYIGTPTHDQDLLVVKDAILKLQKEFENKIEVEVIGAFHKISPYFGKKIHLPNDTEYPNFVSWLLKRVHWDIGIIPLSENKFNESKSYLKFIEYAALDMAIVCSDIYEYKNIAVNNVNCLTVSNDTKAWYNALKKLIETEEIRLQLSSKAREDIKNKQTLSVMSNNYKFL
jgi:glycosyltransferase involved in cell wall biosynthesis